MSEHVNRVYCAQRADTSRAGKCKPACPLARSLGPAWYLMPCSSESRSHAWRVRAAQLLAHTAAVAAAPTRSRFAEPITFGSAAFNDRRRRRSRRTLPDGQAGGQALPLNARTRAHTYVEMRARISRNTHTGAANQCALRITSSQRTRVPSVVCAYRYHGRCDWSRSSCAEPPPMPPERLPQ